CSTFAREKQRKNGASAEKQPMRRNIQMRRFRNADGVSPSRLLNKYRKGFGLGMPTNCPISAFILPKDAEWLTIGKFEDKMGMRVFATCELGVDNIHLTADAPIYDVSHYGAVMDYRKVIPAVIAEIKRRKNLT
ncbi:MAG: hypothetical protein UEE32_07130, partial [Oscillospiraceae bacterium]|nr:hypothetical protein [Oscillospiraceae bacterium]